MGTPVCLPAVAAAPPARPKRKSAQKENTHSQVMFTIAYFFEKVNLFLRDFAGIFGDYCKVVFYQCYTYAESVAKQSFVGADDSVRPPMMIR